MTTSDNGSQKRGSPSAGLVAEVERFTQNSVAGASYIYEDCMARGQTCEEAMRKAVGRLIEARPSPINVVAELQKAIRVACEIIEAGDQRLLASDGPVNGLPPDISLAEWRRMYRALDATRRKGFTTASTSADRASRRGGNDNSRTE